MLFQASWDHLQLAVALMINSELSGIPMGSQVNNFIFTSLACKFFCRAYMESHVIFKIAQLLG